MPKITVTIDCKTGLTRLEVQGVAGEACREFSQALEAALGQVTSDTDTVEMYDNMTDKVCDYE